MKGLFAPVHTLKVRSCSSSLVLEAEPVGLIFPGPGAEHVAMLKEVKELEKVKEMLTEAPVTT